MVQVKNKVCLLLVIERACEDVRLIDFDTCSVHDGWGISLEEKGNAIHAGSTVNMDNIGKTHSHTSLAAHGLAVGLSDGLMGNSEVGHLNIGAGRVVWQDIVKIDVSIKKRQFHKENVIVQSCERAKNGNGRLHLLGLVSRKVLILCSY
jgi:2,3-bisphosphoglycerate-independent phosphoglycerate mutase